MESAAALLAFRGSAIAAMTWQKRIVVEVQATPSVKVPVSRGGRGLQYYASAEGHSLYVDPPDAPENFYRASVMS